MPWLAKCYFLFPIKQHYKMSLKINIIITHAHLLTELMNEECLEHARTSPVREKEREGEREGLRERGREREKDGGRERMTSVLAPFSCLKSE